MKFSAREDIEAPIDFVFEQISDFSGFERAALRRGAEVRRLDPAGGFGPGAAWEIAFDFRGKRREVEARVTRFDVPNEIVVGSVSSGIDGLTTVELVPLSKRRTRLSFAVELKPATLSARLLIQSLKLAKGQLDGRLKGRIKSLAGDIEGRYPGRP